MIDTAKADSLKHRVIVSDIDAYGHANHSAYLRWLEEGRERLLRTRGFSFLTMAGGKARPVIVNINLDFRGPANWGDEVEVSTLVERVGRTSVVFRHGIECGGAILLGGTVTMVFVAAEGGACEAPAEFRAAFGARAPDIG